MARKRDRPAPHQRQKLLPVLVGVDLLLLDAPLDQRLEFFFAGLGPAAVDGSIFVDVVPLALPRRVIHERDQLQIGLLQQRLEHLDHMTSQRRCRKPTFPRCRLLNDDYA